MVVDGRFRSKFLTFSSVPFSVDSACSFKKLSWVDKMNRVLEGLLQTELGWKQLDFPDGLYFLDELGSLKNWSY